MAQSQQQRQKALERKATKRKQKAKIAKVQQQMAPTESRILSELAPKWHLLEALLDRNWQTSGSLVQAMVARQASDGRVAVGVFLIDLGCLGVKSAFVRLFMSPGEYRSALRDRIVGSADIGPASIDLIAKILRESVTYAANLGFSPDPEYKLAVRILGDADPDAVTAKIPLGDAEGNPIFIPGPHDNVESIVSRLERRLGSDGFTVMAPVPLWAFDDDEEDEDDED